MSLSTSTSRHSGNTLLCKETIQFHSTTSGRILIPQYYATTFSLSRTLGDRLTTQDRSRRNRFNQMAWENQAQYTFKILMTNCVIGVQSNSQEMVPSAKASYWRVGKQKCKLLKSCQAQMQAPRPDKRVVQDNVLKSQGRLWLECLNYHIRVFSNEVGVFCQYHEKVWEIKKIDERFVISHQHKKVML